MRNPVVGQNVEYADNRISRYVAQNEKCAVTGIALSENKIHCHHIIPKSCGGSDKYENLVIVANVVHVLIHAGKADTIQKCLSMLNLDAKQMEKLNKLRLATGKSII